MATRWAAQRERQLGAQARGIAGLMAYVANIDDPTLDFVSAPTRACQMPGAHRMPSALAAHGGFVDEVR